MQFILIPHYILHCRQCPGSVIIQLFRNKTPVAASSYGTKIGRHIFSACRINYSFIQRSNAAFKLCRRDAHHPRKHRSPYGALPKSSHSFCHDRPIIFFIALCDPAVALSVAYRQYIQRRNCQRRPAVRTLFVTLLQKQGQSQLFAMTALSFSLLLCATPPLHYLLPIGNISKGGIVSGDPPSGLCLSLYCKKQGQSQLFAMTALSSSLLLCVTPPLHYLLPIDNISKGGIVSGDPPSGLCLSRYCKSKGSHSFFAMTALSFSLLLCVTPSLRYLLPIGNISKGGIVSGDPPSGLCLSRYCKSKGSHSFLP